MVEYYYDAWGNILYTEDNSSNNLANINPYRYRGYRYDEETSLYYLNSRYYNPEMGRFINADGLIGETGDLLAHNMYAYCQNNPVMMVDPSGYLLDTIFDIAGIVLDVHDIWNNPNDLWAWGALGLDVACALLPFVAGGGAALRSLKYGDEALQYGDDLYKRVSISDDAAKWLAKGNADNIVYYGVKKGENVYTGITKQTLSKRLYQHNYAGKGFERLDTVASGLTRNQARAVETYLIDFGSANAMNSYRSISPTRGIYDDAMKWAKDYIMRNGIPL